MKDEINFDRSLNMMGREVSHLPSAKGSRKAALRSADEALAETEGIAAKVSEMVRRIEVELRMKVTEMQSFSPEEMGNIPRKCESSTCTYDIKLKRE